MKIRCGLEYETCHAIERSWWKGVIHGLILGAAIGASATLALLSL